MVSLFALTMNVHAQVTTSAMNGRVMEGDEPVIGATIQAVHEPSGTRYGTITNVDGRFSLQGMRTGGPYSVEISYIGYQTAIYTGITLQLGEAYMLDATLSQSSELLDEVIIVASRSKFAGEKTGAATNISNSQLTMLPSISRSLNDFTRLSPYSGGSTGFAGRDGRLNNITIDGANFNNNFGLSNDLPGGGNPISLDAIEELQVSIAPYDVRQANFVGAGINAITKGGTNTYKGTAYMFVRNEKLRGNSVDGVDLDTRAPESTKTYGFTLGGPIIKDKLFFFVNGEIEDSPSPIHKWKLSQDGVANADQMVSRVTAQDMENFASVLQNKYGYNPGSYTDYSGGTNNKKILARIDWNINQANKLMVRYNYTKNTKDSQTNGTSAPNPRAGSNRISAQSMAFRDNCYTTDNLVNSLSAELNSRISDKMSNQILGTFTKIEDMRGSNSSPFPHIDIWKDGDAFMSAGYELFTWNNGVKNNTYTIVDNFTYYVGAHKLTAGISYEDIWVSNSYMKYGTGYYRYASYDDFVNGEAPTAFGLTYGYGGEMNPAAELRFGQFAFYAQDEWDITNRFKLTVGIRGDRTAYLNDLEENTAISAAKFKDGRTINTGLWPKSRVLWSPRVGFNWDVRGDKTLKVRGGTGIFTGRIPLVFFTNMPTNSGMIQNPYETSDATVLAKFKNNFVTNVDDMKQLLGLPDQAEATLPSSIAAVDRNFKLPQVWKTTLAADYQLPVSFPLALTLEGMYSKDINAIAQENINMMDVDDLPTFNGPDNRYMYPGTNKGGVSNSVINKDVAEAMILTNTSKGYGYTLNATVTAEPVRNLSVMFAYTHTVVKEISGNPGSQAASAWSGQPSVNGPNQLGLQNSQYVAPNKIVASLTYRIPTCNTWNGTTVGIYYSGYNMGYYNGYASTRYSYVYSNDMNQDGVNMDLMYIPKSKDELTFVDQVSGGEVIFTAAEQADAFWKFVNQDPYLKKHKGEYAEAYSASLPWVNRFDVKLTKDFTVKAGKTTNTLQVTFDILNIGNLFKDSWGAAKTNSVSNNGKVLKYEGVNENNVPTYSMHYNTEGGERELISKTFDTYKNSVNCWQLQVGLRYIFN